jgi:hypothetical protein
MLLLHVDLCVCVVCLWTSVRLRILHLNSVYVCARALCLWTYVRPILRLNCLCACVCAASVDLCANLALYYMNIVHHSQRYTANLPDI